MSPIRRVCGALPGIGLASLVTTAALALEAAETSLFGRPWVDGLILAILIGAAVRSIWTPSAVFRAGIAVSQKQVLEIAIVLLGLSIGAGTIMRMNPLLLAGMAIAVLLAIVASYAIGRGFGLSHRLAVLIACGNAICGNTAIVAVAPMIDAERDDIAAAIGFTAVVGIAVVLVIPPLAALLGLNQMQSGVFAGLTVYSVSQVFAATAPIGALTVQVGTLVKLARMLMLGPVMLVLSFGESRRAADAAGAAGSARIRLANLAPWFIIGFVAMIGVRSTGVLPAPLVQAATATANVLVIVAIAALGLSVDIRVVGRAGGRVMSVVALSLATLGLISLALVLLVAH